jgi:hypothetical protein
MQDRPGAHRARFDRHIDNAARQPVIAERTTGVAERGDFRVCGRVDSGNRRIAAAADYRAVLDDDRTHRDLAALACCVGERQRLDHPVVVARRHLRGESDGGTPC